MNVRHLNAREALVTTVEGHLDAEASCQLLHSIIRAAAADGDHLLIDLREAKGGRELSHSHLYTIIRELDAHPEVAGYRIAIVDLDRKGFEKVQFLEAAAREKGYHVRSFLDYEAATMWLQQKRP